ncbi:MAG: YqhA family protein, partial [Methylocystis sp.]|jgi:uncharacterized protein (TIGR00645 family)
MLKRLFESYVLLSRWLLAPFLVMMTVGLLALMLKAGKKVYGLIPAFLTGGDEHLTLEILNLIEITLTGALMVLVTISIYENFISRVNVEEHADWPEWMGHIDFSQLKLKLLTTVAAISSVKLLEAFMDASETNDRDMYVYVGVHVTLVFTVVAFAVAERLSSHGPQIAEAPKLHDAPTQQNSAEQ